MIKKAETKESFIHSYMYVVLLHCKLIRTCITICCCCLSSQVMVGTAHDNWKYSHAKGTSKLHVIDKFSITLQLERRLLYTLDPAWPKATLWGTLPSLVLHVSEKKVPVVVVVCAGHRILFTLYIILVHVYHLLLHATLVRS